VVVVHPPRDEPLDPAIGVHDPCALDDPNAAQRWVATSAGRHALNGVGPMEPTPFMVGFRVGDPVHRSRRAWSPAAEPEP
jgi:hypothetical protein